MEFYEINVDCWTRYFKINTKFQAEYIQTSIKRETTNKNLFSFILLPRRIVEIVPLTNNTAMLASNDITECFAKAKINPAPQLAVNAAWTQTITHFVIYSAMKSASDHHQFWSYLFIAEELGDYNPEVHVGSYVSSMKLALRQTYELERKVIELHKKREPGKEVQIAIDEFLAIARGLETYGIDPHPVKDHRGTQIYVGINSTGISTFASGKRVQHFRWPEVHKINYEGKMFIAHLSYTDRESREPVSNCDGFWWAHKGRVPFEP